MDYLAKEQLKSSVAPEFPNQDAFHARITNGLQAVLRGTRQIPSKRGPEINDTYNAQNRLENKSSDNEKKKPVEMKENNKSSPSSHMFPSDPDDEDLFMMSPRSNRTSASTAFLSKLSSKVRHPSRTDITALQQDHERLQDQVSHFKAEVDKLQSISIYCGSKMDTYINHLQEQITQDEKCMDVVYLSLAGLKQVRDILKGTLTFHGSTIEQDSEFSHIDTAITSLTPNTKTSSDNKLPNSLPVPLLADYGHFQKQKEEFILIESSEGQNDDCGANERTSDNFKPENVDDISSDLID
ncbi:TBC1 domain family member 5-like [Xenia sp. Carnegie-2017]|uniref:TBC1 domain family member 5-like n=1 Tax=Xenia sp. Carnegie-2017 TaxID=2897299 RepID=UPI001F04E114|nr:TBC1 domain family member 5-like [Xenia sp. Carnegie-2017]